MSEDVYSQYLRWTLTESAAATFTAGSAILTGASVAKVKENESIALEVHAIGCQADMPDDPVATAMEYVQVCLSTRSGLTAMPTMDADHVVFLWQHFLKGGVGTYVPLIFANDRYMPPHVDFKNPLLISHPKIYPYIQSTNAAAASAYGYILFTYVLLTADMAIEALEAFR